MDALRPEAQLEVRADRLRRVFFWAAWPLSMRIGAILLLVYVLVAILSPWIQTSNPTELNPGATGQPPSSSYPFGTDSLGYDVFSRVVAATRLDLMLAVGGVAISLVVGVVLGIAAGFGGRWLDEVIMRLSDALQGFPRFVLAIAVAYGIGASVAAIIVATAILNIPAYTRLVRSSVRSLRRAEFVVAARSIGNGRMRIAFRHILPNAMGPVLVQTSLQPAWVILEAAGLSFIGLGIQRPRPEWGLMLSMAVSEFFHGYWWTYVFPGLALSGAVVAFNLFGEGIERLSRDA
jgi:peptide/nickel transport system permease protein